MVSCSSLKGTRYHLVPQRALAFTLLTLATINGLAQQQQNPSPMVEHTRRHERLTQTSPAGQRERLTFGTLYLPDTLKRRATVPLFVHFHGAAWLAETAAAELKGTAVITVQLGAGSSVYAKPFLAPKAFAELLAEAEAKAQAKFAPLTLTAWSAGYGAVREILNVPENFARIDRVMLLDGLHTGYVNGTPGPQESQLETDKLAVFLRFAREAVAERKQLLITHTEIFPGTFASTTETADWLLRELQLKRKPVLKWGPLGTQQLSEAKQGGFTLMGFAGNSAPDHVDQLHALSFWLRR
ncbi:MAG: hypothetical protein HOP19_15250 [Acidobacteria bacterium]|nr:hypothetical protein [Acidobacteriota bacterium]